MDYIVILKIIAIYFIILIIMKFMGKREIGQLSLFDFIVILIIADISVSGLEDKFFIYILGVVVLGIIQKLLAFISLKSATIRNFFDGKQSFIIIDGKLNIKEMKKQSYNLDDLVIQMRLKNIRSISEIRYLILEANGEISTFLYDDFPSAAIPTSSRNENIVRGVNVSNAKENMNNPKDIYPFPVILSGKIVKDNLKVLNLTEEYVINEIKKQGYNDVSEIYYANYENGGLFIAKTCNF